MELYENASSCFGPLEQKYHTEILKLRYILNYLTVGCSTLYFYSHWIITTVNNNNVEYNVCKQC